MARITFTNVGRAKRCWSKDFPGPARKITEEAIYREVRDNGGLVSRGIDVAVDEEGNGTITAGFHTAGTFKITEDA